MGAFFSTVRFFGHVGSCIYNASPPYDFEDRSLALALCVLENALFPTQSAGNGFVCVLGFCCCFSELVAIAKLDREERLLRFPVRLVVATVPLFHHGKHCCSSSSSWMQLGKQLWNPVFSILS